MNLSLFEPAFSQITSIKNLLSQSILGQDSLKNALLIALICQGHLLIEGPPGVGKTLAAKTLAHLLGLDFKRIQLTADLLPSDLIGTRIFNLHSGSFSVEKGPLFACVVLVDEINRAPAKVQSALLEAMGEKQVTIGKETFPLPSCFLVLATQNPEEQEGCYPLTQAQSDRFMLNIKVSYPSKNEEKQLLLNQNAPISQLSTISNDVIENLKNSCENIHVDDKIISYILNIVNTTRYPKDKLKTWIESGCSPRASLALLKSSKAIAMIHQRSYVTPEDIQEVAPMVLEHRMKISYEAILNNISFQNILEEILNLAYPL